MLQFKSDKPVLVIGDVILDYTMEGPAECVSPEAPVPIVKLAESIFRPAGAANVAFNLKAMGIKPILVGLVGNDWAGAKLEEVIASKYEFHSLPRYLSANNPNRRTTVRTRVKSGTQLLARVDSERMPPFMNVDWGKELLDTVQRSNLLDQVSAVVYVDYGKGALANLPVMLREDIAKRNLPVYADIRFPLHRAAGFYQNTALIRMNVAAAGLPTPLTPAYARKFSNFATVNKIVITEGEFGLWLIDAKDDSKVVRVVGHQVPVVDITGAGDTTMAALVAASVSGMDTLEAATLANKAGSLAVTHDGIAVVGWYELNEAKAKHDPTYKKISSAEEAALWAKAARAGRNRRIVCTNVIDKSLDCETIMLLAKAKEMGDVLFVSADAHPGPHREALARMLASFVQVDAVCELDGPSEVKSYVTAIKPNFLVQGTEWQGSVLPGADYVSRNGGRVVFVPRKEKIQTAAVS